MEEIIEIKIPGKTAGYLLEKSQQQQSTVVAMPDPTKPNFARNVLSLCAKQNIYMKWGDDAMPTGISRDIFIGFCQLALAQITPLDECIFRCPSDDSIRHGFALAIGSIGKILIVPNRRTDEKVEMGVSLLRLANEITGTNLFYV